jgi:hypothetical protein
VFTRRRPFLAKVKKSLKVFFLSRACVEKQRQGAISNV